MSTEPGRTASRRERPCYLGIASDAAINACGMLLSFERPAPVACGLLAQEREDRRYAAGV